MSHAQQRWQYAPMPILRPTVHPVQRKRQFLLLRAFPNVFERGSPRNRGTRLRSKQLVSKSAFVRGNDGCLKLRS